MVYYSSSIVTMAASLAISKIFSVKDCPDLEIWVWGRSWSLMIGLPCGEEIMTITDVTDRKTDGQNYYINIT